MKIELISLNIVTLTTATKGGHAKITFTLLSQLRQKIDIYGDNEKLIHLINPSVVQVVIWYKYAVKN